MITNVNVHILKHFNSHDFYHVPSISSYHVNWSVKCASTKLNELLEYILKRLHSSNNSTYDAASIFLRSLFFTNSPWNWLSGGDCSSKWKISQIQMDFLSLKFRFDLSESKILGFKLQMLYIKQYIDLFDNDRALWNRRWGNPLWFYRVSFVDHWLPLCCFLYFIKWYLAHIQV